MWYLVVSIPNLCTPSYFEHFELAKNLSEILERGKSVGCNNWHCASYGPVVSRGVRLLWNATSDANSMVSMVAQWLAHLPLVLEETGSIPGRVEENF